MNGRYSIVPSSATSNGLEFRTVIATNGRARRVTCVPSWLIVSAVQSFMNSGRRQRPPHGRVCVMGWRTPPGRGRWLANDWLPPA
jgi:hypothetical protein